jgi:hypothetical protein
VREVAVENVDQSCRSRLPPKFFVPAVVLLHIVTLAISIDMISDAFIILTDDGTTIDKKGDMLVKTMINFGGGAKTAMFAVPSGKEVSVDVETSSKWEFVVR